MNKSQAEKIKSSPPVINELKPNEIFVFGSNLQGRHGRGAASTALKWGARMNQGEGISGKTYALPTRKWWKNRMISRTLIEIQNEVIKFLFFAKDHPEKEFLVTKIGCGLAGYTTADIANLFNRDIPDNVRLPKEFKEYLIFIADDDDN